MPSHRVRTFSQCVYSHRRRGSKLGSKLGLLAPVRWRGELLRRRRSCCWLLLPVLLLMLLMLLVMLVVLLAGVQQNKTRNREKNPGRANLRWLCSGIQPPSRLPSTQVARLSLARLCFHSISRFSLLVPVRSYPRHHRTDTEHEPGFYSTRLAGPYRPSRYSTTKAAAQELAHRPPALGFLHLLTISSSLFFILFSIICQPCPVRRRRDPSPHALAPYICDLQPTDHPPDADPDRSGYTVTEEEKDPRRFMIVPRDALQQSIFNQIRCIPPEQLYAEARPGVPMPHRRTIKGQRPIVLVGYNESQSAVYFDLTFHPPANVRVFVPRDSWDRGTCGPENVRAAIQKAYLYTLRGDEQPVIVKPTMASLNLTPLRDLPPTRYVPSFRRLTSASNPSPYPAPPPLPSIIRTTAYRAM